MTFKQWWNQFRCDHCFHADKSSFRKVKSNERAICMERNQIERKYIRPGAFGLHEIEVKYVHTCCHCGLTEIATKYMEATIISQRQAALSYPDIEDKPLVIK